MGMLGTGVNLELLENLATEAVVGDHAFDGFLHHEFWAATAKRPRVFDLLATNIAGVANVALHVFLIASENGLLCVDHDDEVTGIHVGREGGFVLATKKASGGFGDASKGLALGIDHPPLAFDFLGFGRECFHVTLCDLYINAPALSQGGRR